MIHLRSGFRQLRGRLSRTLRGQAYSHMLAVLVLAVSGILVISTMAFYAIQEREGEQRRRQLEEHYSTILTRLESGWHAAAVQTRSRIEFTRITEEADPIRWPKLTAFLNAQWAFAEFSNLVILDGAGKVLFRYGSEALLLQQRATEEGSWLFAPEYGQLYRVYQVPLWLGAEGEGRLVLFKSLSNSALRDLRIPETELEIEYAGKRVAESGSVSEQDASADDTDRLRVEVQWPRVGSGQGPLLVVHRRMADAYSYKEHVARPASIILLMSILLWLGLGRWLSHTTRRIEALGGAARLYARGEGMAALQAELDAARARDDEIGEAARAFSSLVETVEARNQEQQIYLETLSLLEEAVVELSDDGRILRASPGWHKLTHQEDAAGRLLRDFFHGDDVALLETHCQALHAGSKNHAVIRLRLAQKARSDPESWIECRLLCHRGTGGALTSIRGVLRDITQTYLHEKQITHMALHDALTGLPNRVLIEDRFKVALRMAARSSHHVGVCFIDLDNFKLINDSLGHKAGDRLLKVFSEQLLGQLRSGDTVARWGGDEFVLLLPDMDSERAIREVSDKIGALMQVPLELDGTVTRVTFSMGVAVYPGDGDQVENLFSHADRAMFYAKAQGRNQICFFQDMTSKGIGKKELYIQNRLARAIDTGCIETWFQPIIDARSGHCTAVEVLARWHDEEYGWISPATFIPMAENLGLIRALGQQIMSASLDAARAWRERGLEIYLAVNVSKRQLFINSFTEHLLEEVGKRGLPPASVVLEVTESVALTDVDNGAERIQELKQAGFTIAIDDFGTGYSSLSQLHEIRADELKIDISFVRRLHTPAGLSMVQAIINLARTFGLKTVAEGVEDEATAARLRELGVDCLQGYLFSQPLPQAEFEAWMDAHSAKACLAEASTPPS